MSTVQHPRVVADRYRLVQQLGQGGMGRVWLAHDDLLHRDVAIKEIVPPAGLTPAERMEMRERTLREARAIARLSHPNVVRIFDVLSTDGDPWIVMEYVRGRSLQEVLATDGAVSPARAADIGLGVLAALRAAHRSGVLHRDVKPGNVLLGDDGRVVLTDFGLATVPGDPVVTRTGLVLGSPAYLAPERARDGSAGPEADLWSLGATLYAAVEGQSPYARPSAIATLAALATEPPAPARQAGALRPVLNGLLRKNPAERIPPVEAERLLLRAAGPRSRTLAGRAVFPGVRLRRPPGPATLSAAAGAAGVKLPAQPNPKGTASVRPAQRPAPAPPEESAAGPAGPAAGSDRPAPGSDGSAPGADSRSTSAGRSVPAQPDERAGPSGASPAAAAPAGSSSPAAAPAGSSSQAGASAEASSPATGSAGSPSPVGESAGSSRSAAMSASAGPVTPVDAGAAASEATPSGRTAAQSSPAGDSASGTRQPTEPSTADDAAAGEAAAGAGGPAGAPPSATRVLAPFVPVVPGPRPPGEPLRSAPAAGSAAPVAPAGRPRGVVPASAAVPPREGAAVAGAAGGSQRIWWWAAAGVAVVLVVVLVIAAAMAADRDSQAGRDSKGGPTGDTAPSDVTTASAPAQAPPGGAPPTTGAARPSAAATSGGGGAALPAGWRMYSDRTGFRVAVPEGWAVSREGTIVYFRERGGSRVLGIDQTDRPKSNPVADWEDQESRRRAAHDWTDYRRVKIEPVKYFLKAADWEFTFAGNGGRTHVVNRGFVTSADQAYAIYWSTPEDEWTQNLANFRLITENFQPKR